MRIVLAGAGLAAQRCAEALRANGHDGPITMVGAEPHAPYDRPPLSKEVLQGKSPQLALRPAAWHAEHGVELRTGTRALELGDRLHLDSGEALPYDRLLIATGAHPIELPGLPGALTLRTLDDARRLEAALTTSRRIAIVGAGLIGQEVASSAAARGVHATLIDALPNPFDALMGPGNGHRLRALHERAGIDLRLGRRLVAVRGAHTLVLDDGTYVEADDVLVAIGVRPDTAWTPWPKGVPFNPAPHIYAAGDATGSAHWEAAARQGAAAARAMLGLPQREEHPPVVWSDQHGVRIQRIGDPTGAAYIKGPGPFKFARDGRIAAVVLMNDPGGLRDARRSIDTPIQEAA